MNESELLIYQDANGKISHQMALEKSALVGWVCYLRICLTVV